MESGTHCDKHCDCGCYLCEEERQQMILKMVVKNAKTVQKKRKSAK